LLGQRFTDTLCGTKVLTRADYKRLKAGRAYFGDFDPFGDFDLIFGAAKLNLKVVEVPIRYANRTYGETQISRFRHGLMLLRMVMVDVLHHIEFPAVFFREVSRALRQGGRAIMVEPAITWGSTLFYRLIHHEPVRMSADPLAEGTPNPQRDPYDSNQAIPTLI